MVRIFQDRADAGRQLAGKLTRYAGAPDVLVLGLPRGGVVTAHEVALHLKVPLDVIIVRKIGVPWQQELAAAAVSETGTVVVNERVMSALGLGDDFIKREVERQKQEIERRVSLYRGGKGIAGLKDKTVILVDDGVATGATMKAAIALLKLEKLRGLVAALPVSPPESAREIGGMVDEFVCLQTPPDFGAVGAYYENFEQVSDEEVVRLLRKARSA